MRPNMFENDNIPAPAVRKRGFLGRLAHDVAGNALMIGAAAIIPISAAIGGGVDMSRAYLAKARLNQACDAAALAGRRAMSNEDLATAKPEALKFFNFNFPPGVYGTAPVVPEISRPETGVIKVKAATTVPTSVMRIFGYEKMNISVECDATQNFDNIDVVLVLDVTGSMANSLAGTAKIASMRQAVMALYDELKTAQDELAAQGLRLRYGIVPYSSSVNVGYLIRAVNPTYLMGGNPQDAGGGVMEERYTYDSRERAWDKYTSSTSSSSSTTTWPTKITESECKGYAQSAVTVGDVPDPESGDISPDPVVTTTKTTTWSQTSKKNVTPVVGTCKITTKTETTTYTPQYYWDYGKVGLDVSKYVTGAATLNPASSLTSPTTSTWNGCIEERQTDSTISASTSVGDIPDEALDLNIDLIPDVNDNGTRWAPAWAAAIYRPDNNSKPSSYCPSQARRLAVMTRDEMNNYVNALTATGSTYHDIGMIWGARFISTGGIFGADNPTSYPTSAPRPVNRYIIYMTDGILEPDSDIYAQYGVETWDQRIMGGSPGTDWGSGASSSLAAVHRKRFVMACNEAKKKDVSIWVIAFGLAATNELKTCASNADQVATSANGTELINKFKEIGKNIGALRLAK